MNNRIFELAADAGLMNYVDNETPRFYFVHYNASENDVAEFAKLLIQECAGIVQETRWMVPPSQEQIAKSIKDHFGVK